MASTVNMTANAAYGMKGHYIARITGRDSKFTFKREFIGRKCGKRNEGCEATIDDPGLYMTCDVDRKRNKDETYYVVETDGDGIEDQTCTKEEAMKLAKLMDSMSFEEALLKV